MNQTAKTIKTTSHQILVQKTRMGATEAFIGSVTLEWLANRVKFASQMPLFKDKINSETDNIIRDYHTIEAIQQRPLDWSRQASLTQYLILQKNHKFPPLLVVVSPDWINNKNASEWGKDEIAIKSATDFVNLDHSDDFGMLEIPESVEFFALDGQHRLMGIQGLMQLMESGYLIQYTKDKHPTDTVITLDNLKENYQIDRDYLIKLSQEKVGIEFIPAVVAGETYTEANRRIRSIFVHVNLMATPLSKGQLALLNEDSGFSIIARKIAVTHPLLREEKDRHPRIDWDKNNISTKSTVLTTLQALQDMATRYLEHYFDWQPTKKDLIPLRPKDEEIKEGIDKFSELFDYLATLPSYQQIEQEIDTIKMRHFSSENIAGQGNFLFRPVSQIALAQALGVLVFQKGFSLETIFDKMRSYDTAGGFSGIDFPKSPWYGIIYDPNKQRIIVSERDLAAKMLIYLLGGINDKMEKAYLREAVARARTIEGRAIAFNGSFVTPKQVGLPDVL